MERGSRLDHWGLLACVIVAISLRLTVQWWHANELSNDRDAYLAIAHGVAAGKGFVDDKSQEPTAFRPPFFPLQLGGLMLMFSDAISVAVLNLAWGTIGVWATWRAGQYLRLGIGGPLAAILVALDPMLLQYSAQPMTEVTCSGLVACLVFWIVRRDFSEERREFGIGVLFGLLVLCRPTFWPMAGLMFLLQVSEGFENRRKGQSNSPGLLSSILANLPWRVAVGTLLIVGPWVLRNQLVMGSPIVMTTHGGYTLLLANNPVFYDEVVDRGWGSDWSKSSFNRWQDELASDIANQLGPKAGELEKDRWQNSRARQFIAQEPGRFLQAIWYRVQSLWSTTPQGDNASTGIRTLIQCVGWYYTVVLLAFASGMLVVGLKGFYINKVEDQRPWWPLLVLVFTVQVVHLVYWTNARMRAPIVPVISLFAVATLRRSADSAKSEATDSSVKTA